MGIHVIGRDHFVRRPPISTHKPLGLSIKISPSANLTAPVAQIDQHRQQKQQRPHGARAKPVYQPEDEGEERHTQVTDVDTTEQRHFNGL